MHQAQAEYVYGWVVTSDGLFLDIWGPIQHQVAAGMHLMRCVAL